MALSDGPGILLMDENEGRARVRNYLQSRAWWTFPVLNENALDLCDLVERTYYTDAANADFHVVMGPVNVMFAHKRRMTAAQLADLFGLPVADTLEKQDIIMAADSEDDPITTYRAALFHDWVTGNDGWSPTTTEQEENA